MKTIVRIKFDEINSRMGGGGVTSGASPLPHGFYIARGDLTSKKLITSPILLIISLDAFISGWLSGICFHYIFSSLIIPARIQGTVDVILKNSPCLIHYGTLKWRKCRFFLEK